MNKKVRKVKGNSEAIHGIGVIRDYDVDICEGLNIAVKGDFFLKGQFLSLKT